MEKVARHKAFYGDARYFKKYQTPLLFLLNNPLGKVREKTREFFDITTLRHITKITPNSLHTIAEPGVYQAVIYSCNAYEWAIKKNFESLQRLLRGFHWWDMHLANKFAPVLNLGFDTLTANSSTSDGYLSRTYDSTWAAAHDAASAFTINVNVSGSADSMRASKSSTPVYYIYRSFFYYNTSELTDQAAISDAVMSLYGNTGSNSNTCIMKSTQAVPLVVADYDSFTGSYYYLFNSTWITNGYNDFTLNAQGISDISKTGTTKICARNYTYDYLDVEPPDTTTYRTGCSFANAGVGYYPKLVITYTIVPITQKSQMVV